MFKAPSEYVPRMCEDTPRGAWTRKYRDSVEVQIFVDFEFSSRTARPQASLLSMCLRVIQIPSEYSEEECDDRECHGYMWVRLFDLLDPKDQDDLMVLNHALCAAQKGETWDGGYRIYIIGFALGSDYQFFDDYFHFGYEVVDLQLQMHAKLGTKDKPGLKEVLRRLMQYDYPIPLEWCQRGEKWEVRPLSPRQMRYALCDVLWLFPLFDDYGRGPTDEESLKAVNERLERRVYKPKWNNTVWELGPTSAEEMRLLIRWLWNVRKEQSYVWNVNHGEFLSVSHLKKIAEDLHKKWFGKSPDYAYEQRFAHEDVWYWVHQDVMLRWRDFDSVRLGLKWTEVE